MPDNVPTLLSLFDSLAKLERADVALFEEDVPGAEYAARLWASSKPGVSIKVARNDIGDGMPFEVVRVVRGHQTLITIHRPEAA